MKLRMILIISVLFLVSGILTADEDYTDKPLLEDGYYRVVESVLQVPSLGFKEFLNELCYVKKKYSGSGSSWYYIFQLEGPIKEIHFSSEGRNFYRGVYYINNQVTSHSRFDFDAEFDSKKGNEHSFWRKIYFKGM